jgi:hypothetical protein
MPAGAPTYTLGGTPGSTAEIISAITDVVPESAGTITTATDPLFTPEAYEGKAVEELLGPLDWRPLNAGVRDTIEVLRSAYQAGRLDADRAVN